MKKLQLLLVALALISFTAFYSCGNVKEKATEAAEEVMEEAEEVMEEVEEAMVDTMAVEAEEVEVEETEEAPAE
ncbi:hypothetical protein ACFLSE_08035 [Bacteroidota bacterium]